ncbi:exported hypothetical protein [Candidatus Sulfopaludibacter sp. SbA3]|nr:exported hypothetical protein [Candidatus Sulfopaludibacter sp. SbA3]
MLQTARHRIARFWAATLLCLPAAAELVNAQPRPGQQAPTIRLGEVLHGKQPALTPGYALLIEFWATWCTPCRENIPHLNQLADEFQTSGIDFLSLTSEPQETVKRFLEDHPMHGIVALDPDGATSNAFGAVGLPTTVLIDSTGTIAAITHPAMVNAAVIKALLAHTPLPLSRLETDSRTVKRRPLASGATIADEDAKARVVVRLVDGGHGSLSGNDQYESDGNGLRALLADAYGIPALRIELPAYLANETYAVQAWVPQRHPETLKPLLQAALVAGASIRVRREQRSMGVLVVSGVPGKMAASSPHELAQGGFKTGDISVEGGTAEMVRNYIEMAVGKSVVLDAPPSARFTFKLRWDPTKPGDFAAALHDQLGLELKAETRTLEFLVVDSLDAPTEPNRR